MRKGLLSVFIALLMFFCVSPVSFAAVSLSYRGDINEDGRVNIFDLLETLKILSHKIEPSERTRQIADMDKNGSVNIFDLLGLLKVISGKEQPETIFWGPVIDSLSHRVVNVGDTLTVYVDNFDGTITADSVKAYLAESEIAFFDFSLEKLLIIVPDGFKEGELKLVVGADTTNSLYIVETGKISGLSMAPIAGGIFVMGVNSRIDDGPLHNVSVDSFEIGRTEITNAQYAEYLNVALLVGAITVTKDSVIGASGEYAGQTYLEFSKGFYSPDSTTVADSINRCWIEYDGTSFNVLGEKYEWPVVFVTWYGASAFARHYGMRLPTEAEWEYAAGGKENYLYPTDDGTIDSTKANYGGVEIGGSPTYVGSYPPNPDNLWDMAGNVAEWCSDWYDRGYYSYSPEHNPTGPETGKLKTARGCGWQSCDFSCLITKRSPHDPRYRISYLGFRVARD